VTITKYVGATRHQPVQVPWMDANYSAIGELVSDPPTNNCTLNLPFSALGFSNTTGTLKVIVTDSNTGTHVNHATVHIKSLERGWDLYPLTNDSGAVTVPLAYGNYTVSALISGSNMTLSSSQTRQVSFTGDKEIDLNLDSSVLQTNATITNGNLTSIQLNKNSSTITILVQTSTTKAGQLFLNLPRTLMDAKSNNTDTKFIVAIDGNHAGYTETKTSTERMLVVSIPAGTKEISVTGTQMVPEFPFVFFALLTGISFMLALYRIRFRK
jgi:hypothetical protein